MQMRSWIYLREYGKRTPILLALPVFLYGLFFDKGFMTIAMLLVLISVFFFRH